MCTCHNKEMKETAYRLLFGRLKRGNNLRRLGVHDTIILVLILEKLDVSVWLGSS